MNFNIMNKPCPSCKSEIKIGFWTIRENIKILIRIWILVFQARILMGIMLLR